MNSSKYIEHKDLQKTVVFCLLCKFNFGVTVKTPEKSKTVQTKHATSGV